MYEIFQKPRSDEFLIDRLKFGAGPAGLPTPVLERGAAVRVPRFMLPSLNQIFFPLPYLTFFLNLKMGLICLALQDYLQNLKLVGEEKC